MGDGGEEDVGTAVVIDIAKVDTHGGKGAPIIVDGDSGGQSHFPEAALAFVVEEEIGLGVVGDQDIDAAIAIVIGKCHAHALADVTADSRGFGDVSEGAVSVVVIEGVGEAGVVVGMTMEQSAGAGIAAGGLGLRVPHHVVHHEQVEAAIAVGIEPSRRHRPGLTVDACLHRHIFEGAIAAIAIQNVTAHSRHEQIGMTVVIVVGGGDSHAITIAGQAGPSCHIFEHAISAIAVEAIPVTGVILGEAGLGRAVGQEDVEQTVAIVVEEGDAAGHGFDLVLFTGNRAAAENEVHAGTAADLFERDGDGRRRPDGRRQQNANQKGAHPPVWFALAGRQR